MKPLNPQPRQNISVKGMKHTLHLYAPKVDNYAIQRAFLTSIREGEEVFYITMGKPELPIHELKSANVKLKVIRPEELKCLESEGKRELWIIMDAGSINNHEDAEVEERESFINELGEKQSVNCLCTYDVSKINPSMISKLSVHHNQLQLTTTDLTVLSGDILDRSKLSVESIEKMVKDNLETIILALICRRSMCGTDLTKTIHLEFNVLLSPGTIYPLLHSLEEEGLITSEKSGKAKTYTVAKDTKMKVKNLVEERIQSHRLLSQYLEKPTIEWGL